MEISEKAFNVINELIEINNDRAAVFEDAALKLRNEGVIHATVNKLAAASLGNVNELTAIARQRGGQVAEGTSISGDLHRGWMKVKSVFTGADRMVILNECKRMEETALAAYRDVLYFQNDVNAELELILQKQQDGIDTAVNLVKSLLNDSSVIDERK